MQKYRCVHYNLNKQFQAYIEKRFFKLTYNSKLIIEGTILISYAIYVKIRYSHLNLFAKIISQQINKYYISRTKRN